MNIQFTDNSKEVLEAMQQATVRALEKCGLVAEGYAKKLCPVDTGNLRNSITHDVYDGGDVNGIHHTGGICHRGDHHLGAGRQEQDPRNVIVNR